MSNQKFEVGDRARVVDNTALRCNIGDTAEIISIGNRKSTIGFEIDLGDYNQKCSKKQIELISKGEDIMEADAIAVEVDDEATYDYLKELAKDNNFDINGNAETHDTGTYGFTKTDDGIIDEMTFHCISTQYLNEDDGYLNDYNYKKIDLDNELGKLKEFLEPDNPEPEIETFQGKVKFKDDGIKIGCKTITNDTIETVYTGLKSLDDNVSTSNTQVKLEARDVELTLDEIEEIYEYQLDG